MDRLVDALRSRLTALGEAVKTLIRPKQTLAQLAAIRDECAAYSPMLVNLSLYIGSASLLVVVLMMATGPLRFSDDPILVELHSPLLALVVIVAITVGVLAAVCKVVQWQLSALIQRRVKSAPLEQVF